MIEKIGKTSLHESTFFVYNFTMADRARGGIASKVRIELCPI